MEQQIVSGIVQNGPGYAAAAALFWLFWKFIQSQIAADVAQSQQRIDDLKEENKTQTEFLMTELSRRDAEMKEEMQKREEESRRREDKLYDLITKELQQINSKLDRRSYDEDQGQTQDITQYSANPVGADLFREVVGLGGRPRDLRTGQSRE